ncbi:MAG: hypothetical protein AAF517_25125, partial [Planctomycetota bacterium]
ATVVVALETENWPQAAQALDRIQKTDSKSCVATAEVVADKKKVKLTLNLWLGNRKPTSPSAYLKPLAGLLSNPVGASTVKEVQARARANDCKLMITVDGSKFSNVTHVLDALNSTNRPSQPLEVQMRHLKDRSARIDVTAKRGKDSPRGLAPAATKKK